MLLRFLILLILLMLFLFIVKFDPFALLVLLGFILFLSSFSFIAPFWFIGLWLLRALPCLVLWDEVYFLQRVCHGPEEPLLERFDRLLVGLRLLEEMLNCRGALDRLRNDQRFELFPPARVVRVLVFYRAELSHSHRVGTEAVESPPARSHRRVLEVALESPRGALRVHLGRRDREGSAGRVVCEALLLVNFEAGRERLRRLQGRHQVETRASSSLRSGLSATHSLASSFR